MQIHLDAEPVGPAFETFRIHKRRPEIVHIVRPVRGRLILKMRVRLVRQVNIGACRQIEDISWVLGCL